MAKEQDTVGRLSGSEPEFEDVAELALPVALNAGRQGFGVGGGQVHAGVYGGFVVGRRLGEYQLSRQVEQLGLLAAGASQEGAHGDCGGSDFGRRGFRLGFRHAANFA
jgi:hypothetical protein